MLKHLSITNYAIIEHLEFKIDDGFTVITGETGAGKSILLGALSLILGQRADISVLNIKDKKCIIEGEFDIDQKLYINFFEENELDQEQPTIIRREINAKGKSRAFINDTPVSLSLLKELTAQLIDIHSQHQTLKIQENKFQINVVDAFAGTSKLLLSYKAKYLSFIACKKQFKELTEITQKEKADVDYITFQANEISTLQLKPNEKETIEAELELINNAEEIKAVLENSENLLINSDQNILSELKNITILFDGIKGCSSNYHSLYERLSSLTIELEDITTDIENNNTELNLNSGNAAYLNERLSSIFSIEQKHNVSSTKEILELLETLNNQLLATNSYEDKLKVLAQELAEKKIELFLLANKISKKRLENFKGLAQEIINRVSQLGMEDASFQIKHKILDELTETGIDEIEFLFSSNKGVAPLELNKAASGGELSRLMLTIKSILAKNINLASIIFDEIDAGVSGDIADKMAVIMKEMSSNMQVISITHLPQVAAKGDNHFKIYKENVKGKTLTSVISLNKSERIDELAKMLSGKKMSVAAKENAKILLEN